MAFIILFATSFLLDLQIVKENIIRKILVYILVIVELLVAFNSIREIAIKTKKKG